MCWRCCRVLAVIGVFSLFAGAAGIVRLAGRETRDTFLDALADGATDGIVVTDQNQRVVYANAAYLTLVDAVDADDVRPVERVFIGDPLVSEAIFRLAKASREGRQLQEEVRVPGADGGAARWLRFRVRPLQQNGQLCALDRLVDQRRDARPRPPGERVPGAAARDRLSRSCAGRLLLGRCRKAPSATSTRRSRAGSTTTSRRSARAG